MVSTVWSDPWHGQDHGFLWRTSVVCCRYDTLDEHLLDQCLQETPSLLDVLQGHQLCMARKASETMWTCRTQGTTPSSGCTRRTVAWRMCWWAGVMMSTSTMSYSTIWRRLAPGNNQSELRTWFTINQSQLSTHQFWPITLQHSWGGTVGHQVPLLLSLAHWRRLQVPWDWERQNHTEVGPGVQVRHDNRKLNQINIFSKYDLYTKSAKVPDIEKLKPYYQGLIDKYLPGVVSF